MTKHRVKGVDGVGRLALAGVAAVGSFQPLIVTTLCVGSAIVMTACSEPPPPPAPPPPPPPPPPVPQPVAVDPILQSMRPDARVQFPQTAAPVDETFARAVISLADALAKGDAAAFGGMLIPDARATLDTLDGDGSWQESTGRIEAVRIIGTSNLGDPMSAEMSAANVYFAVQERGSAYLMGFFAAKSGGSWLFGAAPSSAEVKARATEFDSLTVAQMGDANRGRAVAGADSSAIGALTAIQAFGLYELTKRVMMHYGMPGLSPDQEKQMMSGVVAGADGIMGQVDQGRASIESGVIPTDAEIRQLVEIAETAFINRDFGIAAAAMGGNQGTAKPTTDNLYAWLAEIFRISEEKIRMAVTGSPGAAPAPEGGTPPPEQPASPPPAPANPGPGSPRPSVPTPPSR